MSIICHRSDENVLKYVSFLPVMNTPISLPLPSPLQNGIIVNTSFTLEEVCGDDLKISFQDSEGSAVVLQLTYRFSTKEWVLNYLRDGIWSGQEVIILLQVNSKAHFVPNQDYSITVEVKEDHYAVSVDGFHLVNFRHYLDPSTASVIHIEGPIYVGYITYGKRTDLVKIFTDESDIQKQQNPKVASVPTIYTTTMLEVELNKDSKKDPNTESTSNKSSQIEMEVDEYKETNWQKLGAPTVVKNIKSTLISKVESNLIPNVKSVLVSNVESQLKTSFKPINITPNVVKMIDEKEDEICETIIVPKNVPFPCPRQTGVILTETVPIFSVKADNEMKSASDISDRPEENKGQNKAQNFFSKMNESIISATGFPSKKGTKEGGSLTALSNTQAILRSSGETSLITSIQDTSDVGPTKSLDLCPTNPILIPNPARSDVKSTTIMNAVFDGSKSSRLVPENVAFVLPTAKSGEKEGQETTPKVTASALPKSRVNILNPALKVASVPTVRISASSQEINVQFPESSEIGREEPREDATVAARNTFNADQRVSRCEMS